MTKKKSEPNPIEEAIGDRAKTKEELRLGEKALNQIPQNPSEIPDVPSPQEMLNLEELNRQTEERLRDDPIEEHGTYEVELPGSPIPVSKPDPQPVTKTSSPESPPQKIERDFPCKVEHKFETTPALGTPEDQDREAQRQDSAPPITLASVAEAHRRQEEFNEAILPKSLAEDIELTALRKYILEDGFVVATVAFHIVSLCAQPMTTPSTTMWDFKDRAMIPDMVFALLNQPGYIEGIWPSLKIVMGSNKGNAAWTAGIATTIAFFDVVRSLPVVEELKNEEKS